MSDKYARVAGVCYRVQSRTARMMHPDAHYNNVATMYARHWIDFYARKECNLLYVSADDKCQISVGAPNHAETALTRQRAVEAGTTEQLQTLDHDFNCDSICPSVQLFFKPCLAGAKILAGDAFPYLKDSSLQPSTPMRHAAKTLASIRAAGVQDVQGACS